MCFHSTSLQWRPASHTLHYTKQLCVLERLQIVAHNCRCEPYITLLDQRGDD